MSLFKMFPTSLHGAEAVSLDSDMRELSRPERGIYMLETKHDVRKWSKLSRAPFTFLGETLTKFARCGGHVVRFRHARLRCPPLGNIACCRKIMQALSDPFNAMRRAVK